MALYNVSISVKGLKHISESGEIIPVIWALLDGKDTRWKSYKSRHGYHTVQVLASVLQKNKNRNRAKDNLNCTSLILTNETFHFNIYVSFVEDNVTSEQSVETVNELGVTL